MRKRSSQGALCALAVVISSALLFSVRFSMLEKSPHPTGLDGYYYALQAKSFAENGRLENPDTAPGYYLCGLLTIVCKNAITACKTAAAGVSTALAISVFLALLAMFPGHYARAFAGFLLCAASPSCAQLTLNYINNLAGLTFLFAYLACFYRAWTGERKPSILLIAGSLVLFALACLSHLITAGYAIAFTAVCIPQRQSSKFRFLAAIAAIGAFVAFLGITITQRQRLAGVFSILPSFPAMSASFRSLLHPWIVCEMSAWFVIVWVFAIFLCVRNKRLLPYAAVPVVLFFPFWNLHALDMGYRMFLSAVPCSIVFIIKFGGEFADSLPKKPFRFARSRVLGYGTLCAALCTVLFAALSPRIYDPRRDPPYEYYQKVVSRIELEKDTLLIAHLGLNHVYTYYNDMKMALNYVPDFEYPGEKIWRVAYGMPVSAIAAKFPEIDRDELAGELMRIDDNYILIREDVWNRYLEREDSEIVLALQNWYNPHTVRPSFIRK